MPSPLPLAGLLRLRRLPQHLASLACLIGACGASAQQAIAPSAMPAPEPLVKRTVIEDEGSRIEETRVRGQLQRITVTPKTGGKISYEILPGDGSGSDISRISAGKRVWNVLQF